MVKLSCFDFALPSWKAILFSVFLGFSLACRGSVSVERINVDDVQRQADDAPVLGHVESDEVHVSFFDGGILRLQLIQRDGKSTHYEFGNADVVLAKPLKVHVIPMNCIIPGSEDDICALYRFNENGTLELPFVNQGSQYSLHMRVVPAIEGEVAHVSFEYCRKGHGGSNVKITSGKLWMRSADQTARTSKVNAEFFMPSVTHAYGIPEHTTSFALEDGRYRLYNSDVFKYKLNDKSALYGAVPFILGVSPATRDDDTLSFNRQSVGILWLNASDTSVLVQSHAQNQSGKTIEWNSAVGACDCLIFPGPEPEDVTRQHATITGFPVFHPLFAFGYHQSRWNYKDEADVQSVSDGFDDNGIPLDSIWLDIEHTDDKKYFTWDPTHFPTPDKMQEKLTSKGRYLITITDPHIKRQRGFFVHDEAVEGDFYVKQKKMQLPSFNWNGDDDDIYVDSEDGDDKVVSDDNAVLEAEPEEATEDFVGHCWPGSSSWVDYLNPKAREWYASLFSYDKYKHSTPFLHAWIDMNEPSVFGGEGGTMRDDAVHSVPVVCTSRAGLETDKASHSTAIPHKEVHNLYGFYHSMATYDGLIARNANAGLPNYRPFVLSRAFFAGSQRYAAVWTGDNDSTWGHMKVSLPMCLSLSISNMAMIGADVGGFFNDSGRVDTELLARWYQLGAFLYPFFRGHSHHDAPRMEPYRFGQQTLQSIRDAITERYSLLAYIYTAYYHTHIHAKPLLRPLFFEFPQSALLDLDSGAMLGSSLLVFPIGAREGGTVTCTLPLTDKDCHEVFWYDYHTGVPLSRPSEAKSASSLLEVSVEVTPSTQIPVFLRAGSILPIYEKVDQNTHTMVREPNALKLRIAMPHDPKTSGSTLASGFFFADDYQTMRYAEASYVHRTMTVSRADGPSKKALRLRNKDSRPEHRPRGVDDALLADSQKEIAHLLGSAEASLSKHSNLPLRLSVEKIELWGVSDTVRDVYYFDEDSQTKTHFEFDQRDSSIFIQAKELRIAADWDVYIEYA